MENKIMNSQSAAAENSAIIEIANNTTVASNYAEILTTMANAIEKNKKDTIAIITINNTIVTIWLNRDKESKTYEVRYTVGRGDMIVVETDIKVLSGCNIGKIASVMAYAVCDIMVCNYNIKYADIMTRDQWDTKVFRETARDLAERYYELACDPGYNEYVIEDEDYQNLYEAGGFGKMSDSLCEKTTNQLYWEVCAIYNAIVAVKGEPVLFEQVAETNADETPAVEEVKILEDFCTNEASKIIAAGLTSVALSEEEHYLYDYEALYDYLVDDGFNEGRAYEIRDQYDEEVDRAIRGLLTAPDFVPVEVSDSDIESTERFFDNMTYPYSARGLAYTKEHTSGVYMADIIRAVAEEHWNFESVVKESQWTRFTNDSFRDLIWSTCWAEYLVEHTDEALEAETRYVMDFDSVYDDLFGELWPYMSTYDDSCGGCELWVNAWDVVERAAEIIEESGARCIDWDRFPDYIMTAFLGGLYGFGTFTERVMSELEGGDIIGIMPYDDGLHLSFVNDEAEVAA